jgi:hypothetical protein
MAMDHVQGRLASLERRPTALGSMVSMRQDNFINLVGQGCLNAWIEAAEARQSKFFAELTH